MDPLVETNTASPSSDEESSTTSPAAALIAIGVITLVGAGVAWFVRKRKAEAEELAVWTEKTDAVPAEASAAE